MVCAHGAAKPNCTRVASSINLVGGCDAWCGWIVNLECNCKYVNVIAMVLQAVRSCAAVIVVCLGRYAMSAVWSLVLTLCVSFDCVLELLYVALCSSVLALISFDQIANACMFGWAWSFVS